MITNLTFLKETIGDNRKKVAKFINLYLQNAPAQIEDLKKGMQNREWEIVRRAAHTLKPQLHYMGMNLTKEKALEIETSIDENKNLEHLPRLASEVESDCEESFRELHDFLKSQNKY